MPIEFNFSCQSCHRGSELHNLKIGILKKPTEQYCALDLQLAPAPPVNKIQSKALKDTWFNITILAFFMFLVLMAVSSASTTSTLVADATLYLLSD